MLKYIECTLQVYWVDEIFPSYKCTHGPGEDFFEVVMCAVGAASQISFCLLKTFVCLSYQKIGSFSYVNNAEAQACVSLTGPVSVIHFFGCFMKSSSRVNWNYFKNIVMSNYWLKLYLISLLIFWQCIYLSLHSQVLRNLKSRYNNNAKISTLSTISNAKLINQKSSTVWNPAQLTKLKKGGKDYS